MQYDYIDKSIIQILQGDLPLESHPFMALARELNISEQEIVSRILQLQERGTIRRWGAVLRHQKAGFKCNGMVAWNIEGDADKVGEIMAGFNEVSHCYLREVPDEFGYSMFSMVHARSDEELNEIIRKISLKTGLNDYLVIKSIKELKKVSMKYI